MTNDLTVRELQVADLIAQGKQNKQIAQALGVSLETVKAHVRNILGKLNLINRTQIAVWSATAAIATRENPREMAK